MELSDFVSRSLSQIIEGVTEAQKSAPSHGAFINPADRKSVLGKTHPPKQLIELEAMGPFLFEVTDVQFDVAVTIADTTDKKGGIGVLTTLINIGGSAATGKAFGSESRIKFSVPIAFPHQYPVKRVPTQPLVAVSQVPPGQ